MGEGIHSSSTSRCRALGGRPVLWASAAVALAWFTRVGSPRQLWFFSSGLTNEGIRLHTNQVAKRVPKAHRTDDVRGFFDGSHVQYSFSMIRANVPMAAM